MDTFSIELTGEDLKDKKKMAAVNEFMGKVHDAMAAHIKAAAAVLGVSEVCASAVVYLRSRSRWTEALERELIRLHAEGKPPNMNDWP